MLLKAIRQKFRINGFQTGSFYYRQTLSLMKKQITFTEGTPSQNESKVYGRFVPERYDDFAWENDKIAFRMYGKSLEKVPNQNAWGWMPGLNVPIDSY